MVPFFEANGTPDGAMISRLDGSAMAPDVRSPKPTESIFLALSGQF